MILYLDILMFKGMVPVPSLYLATTIPELFFLFCLGFTFHFLAETTSRISLQIPLVSS